MNILFLTHYYPNYVPDLLLHGLRKLLGPRVVDYPRKDSLYTGALMGISPDDQLCPRWFPDDDGTIDREDIQAKVRNGYFKYIISDVRAGFRSIAAEDNKFNVVFDLGSVPLFQDGLPQGLVFVDGEDSPARIPAGPYVICRRETDGTDFSVPLPMALPEEILNWITSYDNVPKDHSVCFLGSYTEQCMERRDIVEAIARLYPDSMLTATVVPSADNPAPAGRVGRNAYYENLQKSRIVLNLRGMGLDTFRFWENAACNSVHISQRMPLFIPDDFEDGKDILRFTGIDELKRLIDSMLEDQSSADRIIAAGRSRLMNYHTTTKRAMYLLKVLQTVFK